MKEETMTLDQYKAMKNSFDKAEEESPRPYLVQETDELIVARDATETQVNKDDYTIQLTLPLHEVDEKQHLLSDAEVIKEYSHSMKLRKTFKGRFISPRMQTKIGMASLQLMPFFKPFMEDGKIQNVSDEMAEQLLADFGIQIVDSVYDVVSIFLGIPEFSEALDWGDALNAFVKMINNHPELHNEVDSFTSKQS